ncbi:MAG: phosphatidate cytidylyltransferase [Xanthomonadales bacterium]|nr:phosphatidate cytidylyltransferase [Xanthomonadales bacterium]
MFKTRVITALVLLPVFLFLLFGLSAQAFSLFFGVLMLIGGWEYSRLCGLVSAPRRLLYLSILVILLVYLASHNGNNPLTGLANGISLNPDLNYFFMGFWLLALVRLLGWQPPVKDSSPSLANISINTTLSIFLLAGAWYAISRLRFLEMGEWWVLSLFLIVWAADVGAYLCGKQFGNSRLVPLISPGKTRAGVYGGVILSLLIGWLFIQLAPVHVATMPVYLLGVLALSLISVVGDLYVSMHKRSTGIKDSGHLFPGHGGILDRLDSTIATAPFYLALLACLPQPP